MMNTLHKILLFIAVLPFSSITTVAQQQNKAVLIGRVVQHNGGAPIPYVNVFLANTTKGSTTNKDGFYKFKGIPFGHYEIVASMMGYEIQSQNIILTKPDKIVINFELHPKVIQLKEVIVEARDAKQWRKNLKVFEREFFGETENASKCKILNPEILDFKIHKPSNLFTAKANQLLEVLNMALGYRIHILETSFSVTGNNRSYNYEVKYKAKLLFNELKPKSEKEKKKWVKSRLKAYRGSFRHFLKSLEDYRANDEGFYIRKVHKDRKIKPWDYKSKEWNDFNNIQSLASIISPGQFPFEKKLHFTGLIEVTYFNERDWFLNKRYQISYLKLEQDTVVVTTSGHFLDNLGYVKYGYWTRGRFADELPIDYLPTQLRK